MVQIRIEVLNCWRVSDINAGKKFENAIKKSVPEYAFQFRIKDSTGTFSGGDNLRFSSKQPCDAFFFDGTKRLFYAIEMKSTKNGSFSFEDVNCAEAQPSKMVHKHQIIGLTEFNTYEGVVSGFFWNFRIEKEGVERTYFQHISDFSKMTSEIEKKSFNEKDLLKQNPIPIEGKKKRVNYTWNLDKFMKEYKER